MTSIVHLAPMKSPFPAGTTVPFNVPSMASLPGGGFSWGGALSVAGSLVSSVVSLKATDQQIKAQKLALQQQIEAGKASLAAALSNNPSAAAGNGAAAATGAKLALGAAAALVLGFAVAGLRR